MMHHPRRSCSAVAYVLCALAGGCKSNSAANAADAGEFVAPGSDGGAAAGSCRVFEPSQHVLATCIDYVGSDYTAANAPSVCTTNVRSGPSEYSPSPCPVAGRAGSCVVNAGTTVATVLRSYAPSSATAQSICTEAGGVWTPH